MPETMTPALEAPPPPQLQRQERIVARRTERGDVRYSHDFLWSWAQRSWVNGRREADDYYTPQQVGPDDLWYEVRRVTEVNPLEPSRQTVHYEGQCHRCGTAHRGVSVATAHYAAAGCCVAGGPWRETSPGPWGLTPDPSSSVLSDEFAVRSAPFAPPTPLMDEPERRREAIRNYSYKPEPVFRFTDAQADTIVRTAPFMGFELEMECVDANIGRAATARQLTDHFNGLVYCKEDGSLNYGLEMVTHPGTIEFWREDVDWSVLANIAQQGVRAWDTTTAGLHIHLNVRSFQSRSHFARFYMLFQRNRDWWVAFAGRRSHYAMYDVDCDYVDGNAISRAIKYRPYLEVARRIQQTAPPEPDYYGTSYNEYERGRVKRLEWFEQKRRTQLVPMKEGSSGIRGAVNCINNHTVEIRLFRPSLRWTTVVACLESVHAAWEYTRDLSLIKDKGSMSSKVELLLAPAWGAWIKSNAGRFPFLAERVAQRIDDGEEDYGF